MTKRRFVMSDRTDERKNNIEDNWDRTMSPAPLNKRLIPERLVIRAHKSAAESQGGQKSTDLKDCLILTLSRGYSSLVIKPGQFKATQF